MHPSRRRRQMYLEKLSRPLNFRALSRRRVLIFGEFASEVQAIREARRQSGPDLPISVLVSKGKVILEATRKAGAIYGSRFLVADALLAFIAMRFVFFCARQRATRWASLWAGEQ